MATARRDVPKDPYPALVAKLIVFIAVGWLLYLGRDVLIPVTIAIFLSFLLSPIVRLLRNIGIPRAPAVIFSLLLALGTLGAAGSIIASQTATLAKDAPAYAEQISKKVRVVQTSIHDRLSVLTSQTVIEGSGKRTAARARTQGIEALNATPPTGAVRVEVVPPPATALQEIKTIVGPILSPLESMLIAIIVTAFILLGRDDLRDRLIRLMGSGDLHRTTLALDDAASRLSRYFGTQFAINAAFGAIIWIGLYMLGVPSPGLWGGVAAMARFVPYVGPLAAAVGPMALAAAIDPGWSLLVAVALLFAIVEPVLGYLVEPLVYGHSTGLSPVSVIIAALFWTLIWGPAGLILSTPMTLMLVVLGRHVPALEAFDVLLGDRPALTPASTFYQRALTGETDDAIDQAEDALSGMSLVQYYDDIALAGLRLAALDVDRGAASRDSMGIVCETALEVVRNFDQEKPVRRGSRSAKIVCIPGRGPFDKVVAAMLGQLLIREGARVEAVERLGPLHTMIFDPLDVTAIAIVGLFDNRAYVRLEGYVERLRDAVPDVRVQVGVRRSPSGAELSPTTDDTKQFSDTLAAFVAKLLPPSK